MPDPLQLVGDDHPPRSGERFAPRGDVSAAVLGDLLRDGVATLQGPAGSGTSWLAMAVARARGGAVTWVRPGLWVHLADLVRPLWQGAAPPELQQGTAEQLVGAVLGQLRRERRLLVLDDLDDTLQRSPAPAWPRDPDLALLLGALEAGELRGSDAGVLLTSRRSLPSVTAPVRPLPALTADDAARIAGRRVDDLPDAWLRRPGALALLRSLPPDAEVPDIDDPWGDLVDALCGARLTRAGQELLLGLAVARNPAPAEALAEATGLAPDVVSDGLVALLNLGLALHRPGGWRCPRHVAAGALEVLPERLRVMTPRAIAARIAGWYFREGQDFGRGWTSADPSRTSRLGLRYAAEAREPQMAVQFALYGGVAPHLERFGAWRMLRDDFGLAAECGVDRVPAADRVAALLARAKAADRVADHRTVEASLVAALPLAREVGEPPLLLEVHGMFARRCLLGGDLEQAHTHLRSALTAASISGDPTALSDLHNQLGGVALQTGRLDEAETAFGRSLEMARAAGDGRRAASRQAGLAGVLLYRGRLGEARGLLEEAARAGEEAGDDEGVVHRLLNVALVDSLRGDSRSARRVLARLAPRTGGSHARTRCRFLTMRANLRRLVGDLDGASDDLQEASALAAASGDREAVSDLASGVGHVDRTAGRFGEAATGFEQAVAALGPGREESLVAAREAEALNAHAWQAASDWLDDRPGALDRLLRLAGELGACQDRVPERPFFPRWLGTRLLAAEGQLMASMIAGTAPMGLARQLRRCLDAATADPERADTGEPAVRAALAWALLACGRTEEARELARKASFDATLHGLTTVAGRGRVLLGEEPPPWHGQAAVLARLLEATGRG